MLHSRYRRETEMTIKTLNRQECETIYQEAYDAGLKAGQEVIPTPMVVGEETSPLSGEIDYSKKTYFVSEGPCGFAWVNINPARGNFVKYLKEIGAGHKSYSGGYDVWVREFNQSITRKVAFAEAFADVLRKYGFHRVYACERLD